MFCFSQEWIGQTRAIALLLAILLPALGLGAYISVAGAAAPV